MNKKKIISTILACAMLPFGGLISASAQDTKPTYVQLNPADASPFNNGEFQGWGTALCWWANRLGYSEKLTNAAAEAFFSDEGLGLDIARYNLGGGDDPTHNHINRSDSKVPGVYSDYKLSSDGKDVESITYDITKDQNQLNIAKAALKANPDLYFEGFSNSAPYFMTKTGCTSGGGTVNSDGTVVIGTLGKDLLASGIYDVENSVDLKKKMNYLDTVGSSGNIKDIEITGGIAPDDDKPWTTYYITDVNDVYPAQKKFNDLTTENMMSLLGLEDEYNILKNADGELILSADYGANMQVYCSVYSTSGSIYGSVLSEKDYETFLSASIGDACPYGATLGDLHYPDGSRITNVINYNTYLRDLIANHPAVAAAGKTQEVGANAHTVEEALDIIKNDVIRNLNIAANTRTAKEAEPVNATYQAFPLFDEEEYDNLNSLEQVIRRNITSGYTYDSLYYYHIDFWSTFVLMIAVAICLIFSGIKIATTLFEIMFSQLITPFIIATDLNGSGRAKKAIQNMLLSNIVLMIVVILIRIYISVIWGVKSSDYGDNFAVMLIVIIAGAKFVIDGPEILTKLFGIDAGVKSGAATMMAINQSMQMGSYATMGLARAGSSVVHGAGSVAKHTASSAAGAVKGFAGGVYGGIHGGDTTPGKIGKAIGGAAAGTVTGAVGGAFGHTNAGAKDNIANNVKESVGEGFSSGSAGSASKGADGKDGLNGTNGMNGAKGDRGVQGAAGKDGTNGTDARADNNSGNSNNNSNNNGTSQPARGSGFDVSKAATNNNNSKSDTSKGNGFKDKGGK